MRPTRNKQAFKAGELLHEELADSELDPVSGGVVNIKFSFPGIVFRVGKDANGTSFIDVKTSTGGKTFKGTD